VNAPPLFTKEWACAGGDYELALFFHARSDLDLQVAARALWTHPALDGCYLLDDVEPAQQTRYPPDDPQLSPDVPLLGVASISPTTRAPCRSGKVRVADAPYELFFGVPRGSLPERFDVEPELTDDIDMLFVGLAERVHAVAPIRIGLVGLAEEPLHWHIADVEHFAVPEQRRVGFLVADGPELKYFARTVRV
jgi:hypothetical protein